jgi:hypothetical protein
MKSKSSEIKQKIKQLLTGTELQQLEIRNKAGNRK